MRTFKKDKLNVEIFDTRKEMGEKARQAHNPDCVDIIYDNLMSMF